MEIDPAKPTWLLDVDGVLNVFGRPGWSRAPRKRMVTVPNGPGLFREFRIRWAPDLISRIHRLRNTGLVNIVWATTWCPEAHLLEDLWGFPPLQRAWTDDLFGYYAVEAKRAAAREVIAAGGRLVWTDDDAFPKHGSLVDELTADGRALLVKPDQRRGLQPPDMDDIEAFAAATADTPVPTGSSASPVS